MFLKCFGVRCIGKLFIDCAWSVFCLEENYGILITWRLMTKTMRHLTLPESVLLLKKGSFSFAMPECRREWIKSGRVICDWYWTFHGQSIKSIESVELNCCLWFLMFSVGKKEETCIASIIFSVILLPRSVGILVKCNCEPLRSSISIFI